jgi:hypothetical protein
MSKLQRETEPSAGYGPSILPQHEKTDGTFATTGENNPLPIQVTGSNGKQPVISIASDNQGNTDDLLFTESRLMGYGAGTWDRWRNNTEGTLLASAARTASTPSSNQENYNSKGIIVYLNITSSSGTGGLTVQIQGIDPVSGLTHTLLQSSSVTSNGRYSYMLYPGASDIGTDLKQTNGGVLPRKWRVNIYNSDGSSYTYSVGYSLIV